MRVAAALSIAVVLLGGCAFGADKELEAHVLKIAPSGAESLECGWEKNWGSGETEAVYGCVFGTAGDVVNVGNELLMHAGQQGFTVWCDGARHRLEIAGVNGKKTVSIEVLERGFASSNRFNVADTEIPAGHVLVSVVVERRE